MTIAPAVQRRLTCRLCMSKNLKLVFQLPPTPAANNFARSRVEAMQLPKFPLEVNHCVSCGHFQLAHVVDPSYLFSNYAYTTGSSPALRTHFADLAKAVVGEARTPRPNGFHSSTPFVLEIGSNDGTFLGEVVKLGCPVIGIEPAANLAAQANDREIRTWNNFFDAKIAQEVQHKFGAIDAWVATNVLAHIDNLIETLSALRLCSKPSTIGCVEVQYMGDLLAGGLFDMVYHEHLDYHSGKSFGAALARQGWNVTRIERVPTHGGSLRFWVRRGGEYDAGLNEQVVRDESTRDWVREWELLNGKVETVGALLRQQLNPYYRVLCYGAPAKLTTLMYGLKLVRPSDDEYLRFIGVIDDAPSKQWRFAPGTGIPVLPATVLRDEAYKPDAILITAWNYAEGITKRIRDTGYTGPIIVPFGDSK